MPLIKDTTKSRKINGLTPMGEIIFYRLLMKVDGYDNFTADLTLMKAELFPLRGYVRTTEIKQALAELAQRGLISFYESDGKPFLHLHKNKQKLRWPKQCYPLAPGQVLKEKEPKRKEAEAEVEVEAEKEERGREAEKPAAPVLEEEEETLSPSPSPVFLKNIKSSLYDIATRNFKKYFPKEERQLNIIMRETPPDEMTGAAEKSLRLRYVHQPIMKELDKFMNYYLAEIEKWNVLQANSKWFIWLDRKLEYEKGK